MTSDSSGEAIQFITTKDGSNSYYFKVENSENTTKVQYPSLTVNLDHYAPSNATLSDPSSTPINDWYSTAPTFTLTDVADVYDTTLAAAGIASSTHTIKYLLTTTSYDYTDKDVTTIKSDTGVVSQAISGSTTTLTTTAPTADGTWYLYYWVEDGAANSSAIAREMIQVDGTDPKIGDYEVTYSDGSTALNILTFGVFGNQSYTVTVKLSDNLSGVASMDYTVSSDGSLNGVAIITYYTDSNYSDISSTMTCYATATFTIGGEFTDGTITMTAYDYAGNNSEVATLTAETQDGKKVTSWTYTNNDPQVELTWKDQVNTLGWMNSNTATVDMTVTENAAGLREVYYALSGATDKIDTYLLTQTDTSGEDQKTQKYEEGTFTLDSLGEGITTLTVTAVSNAGKTGSNTVDIKVDTVAPTYSTAYTTSQSWTNEDETITFTLEDTTSGVRYDTIKVYSVSTDDGTETDNPVSTTINNVGTNATDSTVVADTKYEVSFTVSENGYYYIVAEDMAGNQVTNWITVDNVDQTKPATPTISVDGTANSEGWYNAYQTVTFTATANDATANFMYATETLVWQVLDSTGEIFASGNSSTIKNGSITCTYTFTQDGEYTMLAYMKDAAGNYSENVTSTDPFTVSGTKEVYVDKTAPTFTANSIEVKDYNGTNTIASTIANFFGFGNYFGVSDGIQISITTTDNLSGVDTSSGYYLLSTDTTSTTVDSNDNPYTGTATIKNNNDGTWTYTITLESSALENESTITVWVYDVAGNKAADYKLVMYSKGSAGSENWQIDIVNPTISVTVGGTFGDENNTTGKTYTSDTTGTSQTDAYYYYSNYPTLSLTAGDGQQSGLYTVSAYVEYTAPGDSVASITTYLFGSSANAAKDYSSTASEKTSSDTDDTYTISADGTYKIYATVVDNANNKADITVTILVDTTAPKDEFTVQEDGSSTSTDLESVDFTDTSNWKTKSQIISFTLTDNFSMVDVSTIALTATGTASGTPALTDVTASDASTATGSFTITENGTYTLTWKDVAGNESSKEIVVSNLDTTNPAAPSVTVTPENTEGDADTGETNNSVTDNTNLKWYTKADGSIATTIDANLDDEKSNASVASTYYTLSYGTYGGTATEGTKTLYASTDDTATTSDAPAIASDADDGVYILHVWNEDAASLTTEAGYTSGSSTAGTSGDVTYYMYVDRNAPEVDEDNTTTTEPASGSTGNDVTLYYMLNDGTGSGLDKDTVKLYYSSDVSSLGTEIETDVTIGSADSDGNITISYTISKDATNTNGYYTLTFADCAGNADSKVLSVTKMDKTAMSSAQVYYSSDSSTTTSLPQLTSGSTTTIDASTYSNVYLYLTGAKADKAVFTYTGTLTSPSGKTYTYEHKADSTAMALWISDTTAVNLATEEGKWTLATKTETDQNVAESEKTATATYYIIIDSTKPTITNASGTELSTSVYPDGDLTTPTNEDVALTFKVSDVNGTIDVSGIESVEVSTDSGNYIASEKDATGSASLTLTEGSDGSYTFYVQQNGTYTITVTDYANNAATYTFTVTNIDKTNPAVFAESDIDVGGKLGSSVSNSVVYNEKWYKQDTDNATTQTWVEVNVPASDAGSTLYTYVAVWPYTENGTNTHTAYDTTEDTGNSYYVTKFTSADSAVTEKVTLPTDGKWNVAIWRQDAAGNITASSYVTTTGDPVETMSTSLVVYTDITMPVVKVTSDYISIEQTGQTVLAQIAKFLTFGNFFNEGFRITLSGISDAMSEVKTVYYVLTDSNATADAVAAGTATKTGSGTATLSGSNYVITLGTDAKLDGYIWIYVEDNAGNVTTPVALKAYESGSAVGGTQTWMIDTVDPTITFSYSSANGGDNDDGTASTGWYNIATEYPTITATATDGVGTSTTSGVSGIAQILRTIATKATEADASYDDQTTNTNVFPGSGSVTTIIQSQSDLFTVDKDTYGDGIYQLTYTATDNALRTVTEATTAIKVDMTRPTLTLTAGTGDDQKTSSASSDIAETTEGTLNGYFTLTKNSEGVGTNWLNEDQLVTLAMSDVTSGFSSVTITTNGGLLKNSSKEDVTNDGITSSNADESFYVCANGTYTITVTDVAGNTTTYVLTVTNVDTTKPTIAPTVTVTAADGSNAATGTSWLSGGTVYNINTSSAATGGATVTITTPEATTGEAPQTTYYILWNTSDTSQSLLDATVNTIVPVDGKYTFTITEDGIWELIVYTEDEAENRTYAENHSESAGQKIYVDIDEAASELTATCQDEPQTGSGNYTSDAITIEFNINDGSTGSGIDADTVKLTYSADDSGSDPAELTSYYTVQSDITDGAKSATIEVVIQPNSKSGYTNGYYTLTYSDLAGNTQTVTKYVWWMDDTVPTDIPVATAALTYSSTYTDSDSRNYYTDTTDDSTTLTLTFTPDTYTGTSVLTTTVTITAPSGASYEYTLGDDGKLTPTTGGNAIDSFAAFDEEGEWTVHISAKNQAGTENTSTYTYYIDTTAPTHSDESGNTDVWVGSEGKTISFSVTDAVSGVDYTSGVYSVVVTPSDGGSLEGNVTSQTLTADQITGLYSFTALSNGTYTVTLTDNVGNVDSSYVITVTYIDTTAPANATVSVTGTDGDTTVNKNDDSIFGWYKIDTATANQITITANEQAANFTAGEFSTQNTIGGTYGAADINDDAAVYTYIKLWQGDIEPDTQAADVTATSGITLTQDGGCWRTTLNSAQDITVDMTEGVWHLKVWTVDAAGNQCKDDSVYTAIIYVDETVPVVDNTTVSIKEKNTGIVATVLNKLTFGNFFNGSIEISVDVTDESATSYVSGAKQLYYYVSESVDGSGNPVEPSGVTYKKATMGTLNTDNGTCTATISFSTDDADALLKGYIWVYAVDTAGNVSEPYALKAYQTETESGSTYWMIDTAATTIRVFLQDADESTRAETDWFDAEDYENKLYPIISATFREGVADNVSGFNSIVRNIYVLDDDEYRLIGDANLTASGTAAGIENTTTLYDDPTEIDDVSKTDEIALGDAKGSYLVDGIYKVVYTVTDNAGNVTTKEVIVQIDTTVPSGTVETDMADLQEPVNAPQLIEVSTSDAMSGVAEVVVTAASGNDYLSVNVDGSEAAAELTLTPDDYGMVSFYVCDNDTYTVTVTDVAGNTYQLTGEDTSENDPNVNGTFVISNMDLENPTLDVTATTPADGDEEVDYKQTEITLVFDEDVVPQAGETITLTDGNGVEYTYTLTGDEEVTKVVDVEDPNDPDATTYKYELVLDLTDFTATEIDENGDTVVTVTPTYTYQTTAETLYVQDTDEYGVPKEDADGNPVYRVATGTDEGPYYLAETDETSGDTIYTKVTEADGTLLSGVTGTVTTDENGNPVLETTSDALEAETTYTITVPTSTFTDAAGNTLNPGTNEDGSISIIFTTMEADTENDEWLVEKHLSSIEVAGATVATETVEGTDPQGEPTTTTVTTITVDGTDIYASPDYDEDTLTYSVFLSPDILDEDYLPILDLIVLVDADEKETDNVTVTVEALDGTLLGDEEETGGVTWTVDSETGESGFIIDKEIFAQVANSFCYINVTTYNHGSTLTYRYLVSIGGLTENTTNQASTDGTVTGVTETKTVPSTKTSVVYRSTTASVASDEDEETLIAEAEGSGDTVDAKTDAKTEDEESEDAGDEDGEVSASGLKQGLALADLLFVVLSLMVAEYSTLRQKKKKRAVNDLLCIGALVLFFVTQPLKGLIGMTDKYTPFFLAILAVQVVVLVLKLKKQDAQTEEVK